MNKEQEKIPNPENKDQSKNKGVPDFPPLHGPETGMDMQDVIDQSNEEMNPDSPI